MWNWDQGRLQYFQFDALRAVAAVALNHDLKSISREALAAATGLPFAAPEQYLPWRNYSRVFKLSLIASERGNEAVPTALAVLLARDRSYTSDEYFHFLAQASTDPSPALSSWRIEQPRRFPLLFALKFLYGANIAGLDSKVAHDSILGAYDDSRMVGTEPIDEFAELASSRSMESFANLGRQGNESLRRQARESLNVISQISYLSVDRSGLTLDLSSEASRQLGESLAPPLGNPHESGDEEILRLGALAGDFESTLLDLSPKETSADGFQEGRKVTRTHTRIERSPNLRKRFFESRPTAICDFCETDTGAAYPWTENVIDLHHLLPLSSGVRVEDGATSLDDVVPVCPTCHRAVHKYYSIWLDRNDRSDFESIEESKETYLEAKSNYVGSASV